MGLKRMIIKLGKIEESIKENLFALKIERKKVLFERKNKRAMGEDEIKSYTFFLFTTYAIIIITPIILLLTWIRK